MTTNNSSSTPPFVNLLTRRGFVRVCAAAGVMAAAGSVPALTGCSNTNAGTGAGSNSGSGSSSSGKTKVRIVLCQQSMTNGLPAKLREKFSEVEFVFTQGQNAAAYYLYLQDHNDLPDILTVRRFSLRDAVTLKNYLVDLSNTDIASNYYQNYITNYTYDDGVINWLPATAEIWCILANKTLFDEKGIDIPTDYASFKAACEAFQAEGIKPFETDWEYDYSCLETLEGFNADALQTLDGQRWRSEYESTTTDTLDSAVWPEAFSHMKTVLDDTGVSAQGADALALGFDEVQEMFKNHEVAMIRSSGSEMAGYIKDTGEEYVMLPYFGETEEQNWLLTYPGFQTAINANSKVDSAKLLEIYTYLLGQEAQDVLNGVASSNANATNVMSYTSDVTISKSSQLSSVQSYIDSNKVFTRLANNDFFTAAQTAVQGMIDGSMDAEAAYTAFNDSITSSGEEIEYDLNFDKGYAYDYQEGKGSESSSALLNTCREVWGTDMAVAYATSFSNSIYEGKASTSQLKYFCASNYGPLYGLELTGAEILNVVGKMVHYDADELSDGCLPVTDDMLPVSSGFEMQIKRGDGEYSLEGITVNGEPIDESKTYSIVVNVPNTAAVKTITSDITIPDGAARLYPAYPKAYAAYFEDDKTKQFLEPTEYLQLS